MDRSRASLNPSGGEASRRDATQPALHDDLMERVLESENMRQAWRRVKSNQGAPGIDGMRIEDFPEFARSNLPAIRQALREGTYRPQPVRRVTIPKPNGGERPLGIPTVEWNSSTRYRGAGPAISTKDRWRKSIARSTTMWRDACGSG